MLALATESFDQDPASVVLTQDLCLHADRMDYDLWTSTVFLPLVLVCDGNPIVIQNEEAFRAHLDDLFAVARQRGIAGLRTKILSTVQPGDDIAILTSIRDHLSATGQVLTSTSMTWTTIRTDGTWRINQIHFNDSRYDPSVTAELLGGQEAG